MTYHHGWLHLVEENGNTHELFNHARTAAYLQQSTTPGCARVHNVLDYGGCESYLWVPADTVTADPDSGACTESESAEWIKQQFGAPDTDPAPWYQSGIPESAEALGFWITEWTGLDSGHIVRASTPAGGSLGGSRASKTANRGRQMAISVILLGESEEALEYLFRWLDSVISSVCSGCATNTMLIRRTCPDVDCDDLDGSVTKNVAELRRVGLASALTWDPDPAGREGSCFLRSATFALEAEDPCMYAACSGEQAASQIISWDHCWTAGMNVNPSRTPCRPSCSEIDVDCRYAFDFTVEDNVGVVGPVLTLEAPLASRQPDGTIATTALPVRVAIYENPSHVATASEVCGLPLVGELYVIGLESGAEFTYDIARRRVEVTDAQGTREGSRWITTNSLGVPRHPKLGCGDYTLIVEPSDLCLEEMDSTAAVPNGDVLVVAPTPSALMIGGGYTALNVSITVNGIARINRQAVVDESFQAGVGTPGIAGGSGYVADIGIQADGKIVIVGDFTTCQGATVNNMARLNIDGTIDTTFNTGGTIGTNGAIERLLMQPDGKIIIVGTFTATRGTTTNRLARLDTDGSLDTSFNTGGTVGANSSIYDVRYADDGDLIICGAFTTIRGTTKNRVAKIAATDATLISAWNTGGSVGLSAIAWNLEVDPVSGDVIVGGEFLQARGTSVNRIARLAASDGTLVGTWNTGGTVGVNGTVYGIDLQFNSNTLTYDVIIGGSFTTARGITVNRYARLLEADGSLDTTFNTGGTVGVNNTVFGVLVDLDGSIWLSGIFSQVRGDGGYPYLVRLTADTGEIHPEMYQLTQFVGYAGAPEPTSLVLRERMGCA